MGETRWARQSYELGGVLLFSVRDAKACKLPYMVFARETCCRWNSTLSQLVSVLFNKSKLSPNSKAPEALLDEEVLELRDIDVVQGDATKGLASVWQCGTNSWRSSRQGKP